MFTSMKKFFGIEKVKPIAGNTYTFKSSDPSAKRHTVKVLYIKQGYVRYAMNNSKWHLPLDRFHAMYEGEYV